MARFCAPAPNSKTMPGKPLRSRRRPARRLWCPAQPASPCRTVLALRAVVGGEGLALVMSIHAAAEHESAHGAASMALGDESALDALLYPLAAGAQPRSALRSPVLRVARPTLCLALILSLCGLAAAQAWRAPTTSSTRRLWMARCAAALRATFAWLGSPDRAPFRRSRAAALWCPSSRSRCSAMLWRAPRAAIVEPPPPPPVLPAAAAATAAAAAAAAASGGLSSTSSASGSAAAVARCAARAAVRRSAERAATAAGCAAAAAGRFLAAPGAAGAALAGRYWSRWTSVHGRPSSTAGSLRHACCLYVAGRASR